MKKIYIGITLAALLVLLLASAFAFSVTLQNLHINAASFSQSLVAPVEAAAMTSSEEAELAAAPIADSVRFDEFRAHVHLCDKDKTTEHASDF